MERDKEKGKKKDCKNERRGNKEKKWGGGESKRENEREREKEKGLTSTCMKD